MAEVAHLIEDQEPSPRSTILLAEIRMTAAYPVMNDSNMASDVASPEVKLPTTNKEDLVSSRDDPKASSASEGIVASDRIQEKEKEAQDSSPPTPIPHEYAHHLLAYANLTPQQGSGYYLGYLPHQQHMIPEPASPGPPHTAVYDVSMGSFFQPHSGAAFHPTSTGSPFLVSSAAGTTPLSPSRGSAPALSITGSLPPASPLFPRVSSGGFDITNSQHRVAPNIPYMASAHLGTPPSNSSNYQTYPSVILRSQSSDEGAWGGDSRYVVTVKTCINLRKENVTS